MEKYLVIGKKFFKKLAVSEWEKICLQKVFRTFAENELEIYFCMWSGIPRLD